MISRTVTSIENLKIAEAKVKAVVARPISYDGLRAISQYVQFTEEFAVDIPGAPSIVVVNLGPGRIRLDVDRGDSVFSKTGTDINHLTAVELTFVAWLRGRLEQWQAGEADLIAILEQSKGFPFVGQVGTEWMVR